MGNKPTSLHLPQKTSLRWCLLLILANFYALSIHAQQSLRQQGGYYTFGLNAGLSYQSSDVQALPEGFGLGLTLGKNLFYKPGAPISFDLRGRLLYAQQFGLDAARSFDISNNSVLNGSQNLDYTNYPANLGESQGFVFQNHQTEVFELGLEGVLTLNRLRERTGVVASIYGGLGLDWYRASIDQADASGNAYYSQYAGLDQQKSKASIRTELQEAILDGNYESLADGFDNDGGAIGLMPSLGLELGYEVTPNFSIHAGHRFTFAGTDILDGHQWADPGNDIYHYTNFALRWKIRPKESTLVAPVIEIITPNNRPFTSTVVNGLVRARIRHVQNAAAVSCTINGREQSFTFNRGSFSKPFRLDNGANEVIITATNSVGTAQEKLTIYYEEPVTPDPVVRAPDVLFTQPRSNNTQTSESNYQVQASINEINSKEQIDFRLNGQSRNFQFNPSTGRLSATINLQEGNNTVRIVATNSAGRDEESVNIEFQRGEQPIVTITRPNTSPFNTDRAQYTLEATIRNVPQRSGVTLLSNGRRISSFNFDPSSGRLSANLTLREGNNSVQVSAENAWGQDQREVNIIYEAPRQVLLPQVRITSPNPNFRTSNARVQLRANTQNVQSRSDIRLEVNNRAIYNFRFSNGAITADLPLQVGFNQVTVRVQNVDGQAEDALNIERIEDIIAAQPPRVSINQPSQNFISGQPSIQLVASVINVERKTEIQVLVNGRSSNNFNFNLSRQQVSANISLIPGNNNIEVIARTTRGSDRDRVNVNYRQNTPPTVSIVEPFNNATVRNNRINFRANTQNITQRNQIRLLVNGRSVNDFNFNANRREVTGAINLQEGNNSIEIQVANNDGQTQDRVNVNFQNANPPTVDIVRPINNSTTETASISFNANTTKISKRSEIRMYLNGQAITNFDFNLFRGTVTANLNLREGNNTIRIQVQNSDGSNQDEVNVQLQSAFPPSVRINSPASNSQVNTSTARLRATTQSVQRREEVRVFLNGQAINNFSFNASRQEVVADLSLTPGRNTINVQVQNNGGSAQDEVRVEYRQQAPPSVQITAPQANTSLTNERVTVKARTENVGSRNDILFTLNGSPISNFGFQSSRQELTAQIVLKPGTNTIRIEVNNRDGRANDQIGINFQPPKPPQVNISSPSSGTVVNEASVPFMATTQAVNDKSEISLLLNGIAVSAFDWNGSQISANLTGLKAGDNTILVKVSNRNGSDEAQVKVNYTPPVRTRPPSVTFLTPVDEETTHQENVLTVRAKILNVTRKDQIRISVNRSTTPDFNFNPKGGTISFEMKLQNSRNVVAIFVTTDGGTANDRRIINYVPKQPDGDKPFVRIESLSQPTINPLNPGAAKSTITATVKNVTAEQISLMVNNQAVTNFNYNAETGFFQCTFTLQRGENRVVLSAASDAGSDQGVRTIKF
ncbi:MAG: hypothetical protein HRU41_21800 [Saprospiraceae bacterium]|nr:hypothetical protein [Saprospiraceae bacterium]